MMTLRPLIEFEREISALAATGVRAIAVPDRGLIIGESLTEGVRRMNVLTRFAKTLGVTLYIRNEFGDDLSARALPPKEG
jgi:hypothetical protein